jgi:hypothetical protein
MVTTGKSSSSGQAILELTLSSGIITLVIFGSGWILRASWDRLQCARLTFERAHAALLAEPTQKISRNLWVEPERVVALSHCGSATEHLAFEKLESIQKRRSHGI